MTWSGLLLSSLLSLIPADAAPGVVTLQAGAATCDITPPTGFPMWGYGARHDLPSVGVIDPLQARCLIMTVGDTSLALVGLDLGRAPTRTSTATIEARVRKAGITNIALVGSHTHHGPVIETDRWPSPEKSYVRQLEDKLTELILTAAKNRKPARIGAASREVPFNRNRHSKRMDKPVDKEFLVLRVEDEQGKPIAHAVNFAAHPVMEDGRDLRFSPDYVGHLRRTVEQATGAPCLFLQGAAGDLSVNAGEFSGPKRLGERLGEEALSLIKTIKMPAVEKPTFKVQEDQFTFKSRVNHTNPLIRAAFVTAFFKDLVDFYEQEYRQGIRPRLTTALLNDQIAFVGVSGEFYCSHSLNLKRRARLPHVVFLGYCNDYQQYFPTIEGASEGGYGADPEVSPVEIGAGEQMMDRALIQLYRMQGRLPDLTVERLLKGLK